MVHVTQQSSLRQWLKKLTYIHEEFANRGDEANVKKARQLLQKAANEEFAIAFCGHFSAGKSSIINALLGEPLLPSSPIPTSANLVKVKSGREYVRVFYKHEPPVEYAAPYDYEQIRAHCKNGDAIEAIEISRYTSRIPKGIVMMDTPGIDSTDDAHRLATESALHLADVVFYMMDYNHVQSELNFQFTKELTSYGKTLYLIVNQIDKHRDQELSFLQFRQTVYDAFRDWRVPVERMFFTSLKEQNHPYNEFNELVQCLQTLFHEKEERFMYGVEIAAKRLIDDHLAWLQHRDAEAEEAIHVRLAERQSHETEENVVCERLANMKNELQALEAACSEAEAQFRKELDDILEHAYIMPFETRELAKAYLESIQSDFKVGLFFTKSKTEQERTNRLRAFYENLKEKAISQMEWHLRELLVRFLKQHGLADARLIGECQQWTVAWKEEVLRNLVKKGAGLTGEYVLNYTHDVANELKKRYRDEAMRLFAILLSKWQEKTNEQRQHLLSEIEKETAKYKLIQQLNALKQKREQIYVQLLHVVETDESFPEIDEERIAALISETLPVKIEENDHKQPQVPSRNEKAETKHERAIGRHEQTGQKVQRAIEHLRKAAHFIDGIAGMNRLVHELTEKAKRLEHRTFTVALFGAFSAGKSSFANALMGERVLPSSPNPTTATINKIVPPTHECPHGTVIVQLKTSQQLLKDLQASLRYFHMKAETLEEALALSEKALQIEKVDAREKPHYSFIQSVVSGYVRMEQQLGRTLQIDLEQFEQYVADEATACFVEWIELHYDCALTRQGITIVDTPGADSINARHTGVAFEYIKNADAVLFVTYYNHAFSKADREFLIQLGRVKDTFTMDKMFFVVNAADLAHSHEELQTVLAYIEDQLARFGIRSPRLYALSSRFALDEKTGAKAESGYGILTESGIRQFEEDFTRFMMDELAEVAVAGAYAEMERAKMTLRDYIKEAEQSNEEKAAKLKTLASAQAMIQQLLPSLSIDHDLQALKQEISELVYYVKQRISFRLNDWFKEAFNPASLRDDGRDVTQALQNCLQELLHSVGFDLAQEMRATSLRIERFLISKVEEHFAELTNSIYRIHEGIPLSKMEQEPFMTMEFAIGLEHIDATRFKKALSLYKNAKSFFERDEKRLMKEEIEKQLQQPINEYVAEHEQRLFAFYKEEYEKAIARLSAFIEQQVDDYFAGLMTTLTERVDMERLRECENQLAHLLGERA
ncbi:dynamin family protein [Thermaerobacillus caldiproteolyticus]|uniref:dynamin family protein n=1 Tax=Thermaerobacillus caldiproteolyticus TaxID=247480 RepID=UPI00188C60A4|nr:dynamin family protein [Anoxybacillus caldiproteolyticus]QPA32728.1 dynamin family protein [Anoxybacillus caldiproteolyticus]